MRRRNLGETGLKRRRRAGDAMADYDRLPRALRAWLAGAALPWSPRSVSRAYAGALARAGGDAVAALAALDAIEARQLARDTVALRPGTGRCPPPPPRCRG